MLIVNEEKGSLKGFCTPKDIRKFGFWKANIMKEGDLVC